MTGTNDLAIAGEVLHGIAHLALDQVEGVRPLQPAGRMGDILGGRRGRGIVIERDDDGVWVALSVSVDYGVEIPKVAVAAQRAVREAVASMTGLTVKSVNVSVESVQVREGEQGG